MLSSLFALLQIPSPTPTGDEFGWVLSSAKWVVEQFVAKNYVPAAGMVVMLMVYVFNRFFKGTIKPNHLALVSAAMGVIAAVGTNLLAIAVGSQPTEWLHAIFAGLTLGATASGFWSLVGKWAVERLKIVFGKFLPKSTQE